MYREAGGHAYGSPYSGPIGAVVSPLFYGLEKYEALPQASSLCGACLEVCPVRIDLPRMLLALREDEVEARVMPAVERASERLAARVLGNPRWMGFFRSLLRWLQKPFLKNGQVRLPGPLHPTGARALPSLAEKPFREMWDELEEDDDRPG